MKEELSRMKILDQLKKKIRELSGGLRRRVEVARALLHKPEMVRQLTHHLADKLQRPGGTRPEVRAWIATALNGRGHQLLLDPKVNLASKSRSLGHADWILPLVKSRPTKPPTRQEAQAPSITPQHGVISWSRGPWVD